MSSVDSVSDGGKLVNAFRLVSYSLRMIMRLIGVVLIIDIKASVEEITAVMGRGVGNKFDNATREVTSFTFIK